MSESKKPRMQGIVDEDAERASLDEWLQIRLYRGKQSKEPYGLRIF